MFTQNQYVNTLDTDISVHSFDGTHTYAFLAVYGSMHISLSWLFIDFKCVFVEQTRSREIHVSQDLKSYITVTRFNLIGNSHSLLRMIQT